VPGNAVPAPHVVYSGVDTHDQIYGPERAARLVALLRALVVRIQDLDHQGRLLEAAPELQRLLGDARSELFHYEVRQTYDTPEIAESRRIVDESERRLRDELFDEPDDDEPWRKGPDA
jgi:hypothetical protein